MALKLRYLMPAIILLMASGSPSCTKSSRVDYSFFVAGHTYGKPFVDNEGLHPPFVEKFDLIRQDDNIRFGVLTGDIVWHSTPKDWDEVDAQLATLGKKIYIAPGNHDLTRQEGYEVSGRELFEQRYGKSYYSFHHGKDLFIVLDPSLDNWNISGDQLLFLKDQLAGVNQKIRHVFVFFHQVLWWAPDNKFAKVRINTQEGRAGQINFWTEVEPLFKALEHQVYMFSGDVGAHPSNHEFFYYEYDNIHLISSGMGGEARDNFVIVEVMTGGTVRFHLIALNCGPEIDCLGNLEDYKLPG